MFVYKNAALSIETFHCVDEIIAKLDFSVLCMEDFNGLIEKYSMQIFEKIDSQPSCFTISNNSEYIIDFDMGLFGSLNNLLSIRTHNVKLYTN